MNISKTLGQVLKNEIKRDDLIIKDNVATFRYMRGEKTFVVRYYFSKEQDIDDKFLPQLAKTVAAAELYKVGKGEAGKAERRLKTSLNNSFTIEGAKGAHSIKTPDILLAKLKRRIDEIANTQPVIAKKSEKHLALLFKIVDPTEEMYLSIAQHAIKKWNMQPGQTHFEKWGDVDISASKDHFGKTTVKFTLTSGQSVLINIFDEDAYRGPQHADFRQRLQMIYDSVQTQIIDKEKDLQKNEQLKINLNEQFTKACRNLINIQNMYPELNPVKITPETFKKVIEEVEGALAGFVFNIQDTFTKLGHPITPKEIKQAEIEHISSITRPTIINTYTINSQKFFSMQVPRSSSGKTIPSTRRDRSRLVNYVTTYHGTVNDNHVMTVLYEGIRHTSYPPIQIENRVKRQALTLQNVKEGIRDIAKKKLEDEQKKTSPENIGTKDNPICINLRTMMLLTAKRLDKLRNRDRGIVGKWKGKSESGMLDESYLALMLVHGQTFQVEINGERYFVRPDISVMNHGINQEASVDAGGIVSSIPFDPLQREINQRGIYEFTHDVMSFCKKKYPQLDFLNYLFPCGTFSDEQQVEMNKIEEEISELNSKLIKLLEENSLNEREIGKHEKLIKSKRERLKKFYALKQAMLEEKYADREFIKDQTNKMDDLIRQIPEEELQELLRLVNEAHRLYYTKECLKAKYLTDLPTIFLLAQNLMGNNNEFFCKSGEDRTGHINNCLEEQQVYYSANGHYALDEDAKKKLSSNAVFQFSASQDNTGVNSGGARGLQIKPKICSRVEENFVDFGRAAAKLANSFYHRPKPDTDGKIRKITERFIDIVSTFIRPSKPLQTNRVTIELE